MVSLQCLRFARRFSIETMSLDMLKTTQIHYDRNICILLFFNALKTDIWFVTSYPAKPIVQEVIFVLMP